MNTLIGETLVRYQEPAEEGAGCTAEVPLAEAVPEGAKYLAVLFSAEYCPPCQRFAEPLEKFWEQIKGAGDFHLVLCNCDKSEEAYHEHLKSLPWIHALPYESDLVEPLEDRANAAVVPTLAVFSVAKGFDRPVVGDIKGLILKTDDMETAVNSVREAIAAGEEAFDKDPEAEEEAVAEDE